MIVDATWHLPNTVSKGIYKHQQLKGEIRHYSSQYSAHLNLHPNNVVVNIMAHLQQQEIAKTHAK
jgi:hypothetical protein